MATQLKLKEVFGLDIPAFVNDEGDVPVLSGPQRQGDIRVVPVDTLPELSGEPIPTEGVVLVRGEAMGNTHLLLRSEGVTCKAMEPDPRNLTVAYVAVADGCEGYLHHIEHGYLGLAPGNYRVKRQREQADQIRLVAD